MGFNPFKLYRKASDMAEEQARKHGVPQKVIDGGKEQGLKALTRSVLSVAPWLWPVLIARKYHNGRDRSKERAGYNKAIPIVIGFFPPIFRLVMRFLQFWAGILVICHYAIDLVRSGNHDPKFYDPRWVYVVLLAVLSCLVSIVLALPVLKPWHYAPLDLFLCINWLIAFGIFGKLYIPEDAEGNSGIERMKRGVWVDLTNMLLWDISAAFNCYGMWFWYSMKKSGELSNEVKEKTSSGEP